MGDIFENNLSDKGLLSNIFKEHFQFNNRKQMAQLKMNKDLNRHISREKWAIST